MVDTVIFSFDRAMQLSLLLESIVRHDIHKYLNVNILFCYSAAEYKKAYKKLQNKYPQFGWIEETVFNKPELNSDFDFCYWHNYYWWLKYKHLRKNKSDFKHIILQILSGNRNKSVMFLTDDSVFYRDIEISNIQDEKTAFSLRHGKHLADGEYKETENGIEWNVYENDETTDWGYPFSVDGHIYNKAALLKIIRKIIFNNPNTMEGNIACYFKEKYLFPQMKANKCSCLAGFELNRVQAIVNNHHLGISQEQLNRYFLDDYQLQIQFDTTQIQYFRPEIEFIYAQKKGRENKNLSMMREIGISVITPVYNRQDCIGRCIESVANQHYPNVEYWIIDDGSTDATSSVIDKYARQYPFIKVCRFEKNRGVNAARNYAIQNSSKNFILFLDSDDYFTENALYMIDQTISTHPEYRHYLFAQDDRMSYYNQNPLLLGETAELTFADFLTGKAAGDFLHVISASLLQAFPFDEYLRIYEGLTFLSIYKEGQKQYFTKQILVNRERGRSDSVTKEYFLHNTDTVRKQIQALSENLLLFEADYKQLGAEKELQALKRRLNMLKTVLKFWFLLKPAIFVYSFVKHS